MDSSSTTIKKTKVRRKSRKVSRAKGHKPFIRCLIGCYSCRWKRHEPRAKRGHCCCGMYECVYFILLLLTFSCWFTFLYMWGEAKNDYHNFDGYAYGNLGFWFQWSTLLLFLAMTFFLYFLILLFVAVSLLLESQKLYLHWSHKVAMLFFLLVSVIGLLMITLFWKEQWNTFYLSFQITAPFFHMGALLLMIIFAWPVALHFFRMINTALQVLILGPYLAILLFLLFIPLGMYSPCIREKGTLSPKPGLIGHRGAPMIAPENTEMSFLKTIEYGAYGLETDVALSYDGVPFLMHDETLQRTTDVMTRDPSYVNQYASMFKWSYLEKLNSGNWFFEKRPFFAMPPISHQDTIRARNQKIFKFIDFLKLADKENKSVIFDIYRPPKQHPYRNTFLLRLLQVIHEESQIKPELVLWLYNPGRKYVSIRYPKFQQTGNAIEPIESLKKNKIVNLNLDYRKLPTINIRKYAEANITTNLWVVNEPWVFSLAWCYGAHSVTTNAVHTLGGVEEPYFLMTPQEYNMMWILTNTLATVLISIIFAVTWWQEVGKYRFMVESCINLESSSYNVFRAESDKMPTVD